VGTTPRARPRHHVRPAVLVRVDGRGSRGRVPRGDPPGRRGDDRRRRLAAARRWTGRRVSKRRPDMPDLAGGAVRTSSGR
jgi:hypothetical protein